MQHWSWWLSGVALAGVPVLNWLLVRRLMAVSGRYTALVDRVRLGPPEPEEQMTAAELMEAVRAATADAFGQDALLDLDAPDTEPPADAATTKRTRSPGMHLVFLVSLGLGGLASALMTGSLEPSMSVHGASFGRIFGPAPWVTPVVLVLGGALVGFGTRMASGCTSGHGLCGVSRAQPGSLAATTAFFAMGVAASLAMEAL